MSLRRSARRTLIALLTLLVMGNHDAARAAPEEQAHELWEHMQSAFRTASGQDMPRDVRRDAYMFSASLFESYRPPAMSAAKAAVDAALIPVTNENAPTPYARFERIMDQLLAAASPRSYRVDIKEVVRREQLNPKPRETSSARKGGSFWIVTMPAFDGLDSEIFCDELAVFRNVPRDVKGVVLDLSRNTGGALWTVECIAAEFVGPQVPIYQLLTNDAARVGKSRGVARTSVPAGRANIGLPLLVVVDPETNGSALLLAATLRDLGRAKLAGQLAPAIDGMVMRGSPLNPPAAFDRNATRDVHVYLPAGELALRDGRPLAAGVLPDMAIVQPDESDLLEAAVALLR